MKNTRIVKKDKNCEPLWEAKDDTLQETVNTLLNKIDNYEKLDMLKVCERLNINVIRESLNTMGDVGISKNLIIVDNNLEYGHEELNYVLACAFSYYELKGYAQSGALFFNREDLCSGDYGYIARSILLPECIIKIYWERTSSALGYDERKKMVKMDLCHLGVAPERVVELRMKDYFK